MAPPRKDEKLSLDEIDSLVEGGQEDTPTEGLSLDEIDRQVDRGALSAREGGEEPIETINEDEYIDLTPKQVWSKIGSETGQKVGGVLDMMGSVVNPVFDAVKYSTGNMNPLDEQAYMGTIRRGQDAIGQNITDVEQNWESGVPTENMEILGEVGGHLLSDPTTVLDPLGQATSTITGMTRGAQIGGMVHPLLAVVGAGVGGIAANMGWEGFSDLTGVRGDTPGQFDRSLNEYIIKGTSDVFTDAAFGTVGYLSTPRKATDTIKDLQLYTKSLKQQSLANNSRSKLFRRYFGEEANAAQGRALDVATESIADDVLDGVVDMVGGRDNLVPGEMTEEIGEFLLGPYKSKTSMSRKGGGFLDEVGQEVGALRGRSDTTFGLSDFDSLAKRSVNIENVKDSSRPVVQEVQTSLKKAMTRKLASKTGVKSREVDKLFDLKKKLSDIDADLATTPKSYVVEGGAKEGKEEAVSKYIELQKKKQAALEEIQNIEGRLKVGKLTPEEAHDVVRKETANIKYDTDNSSERIANDARVAFRQQVKKDIEDGMTPDDLTAFQEANTRYHSAATLSDLVDSAAAREVLAGNEPNYAILQLARVWRDVRLANTPPKWSKYKTFLRAYQATGKASMWTKVLDDLAHYRPIKSKTVHELFSPGNVQSLQTGIEGVNNLLEDPVLWARMGREDRESLVKWVDNASQLTTLLTDGTKLPYEAKRKAAKSILSDIELKSFLGDYDDNPDTKELDFLGNEPLSAGDDAEYRRRLKNDDSIDSTERGKLIQHLNKTGKVMERKEATPKMTEQEKEALAVAEAEAMARKDLHKMKSSLSIVKNINKKASLG